MIFMTAISFLAGGSGRYNCKQIGNKQLYTWGEKKTQNNTKNTEHKIESKTYKTGKQT